MQRIPDESKGVLVSTPDTVSRAIRFAGTQVMVEVFLDSVAEGPSVDETCEHLSTLPREGALADLMYQNNSVQKQLGLKGIAA